MKKIEGILVNKKNSDRLCVRYGLTQYTDGFNCGECLDLWDGKKWVPTRLEIGMEDNWYCVGFRNLDVIGLRVRIEIW